MTRQLMVVLLTLILTIPVIAETETSQGEWWTSSFRSEMDNAKTCEAGTRLALEESGSNTPRTAVLMASYSSTPGNTPKLSLVFVGDRPASNTISVRFDAKPVLTPPTINDYAVVTFTQPSPVLQRVRNAMTMKVNLNLMYHGYTALTFSLRGSARAMDSAKAECAQGE